MIKIYFEGRTINEITDEMRAFLGEQTPTPETPQEIVQATTEVVEAPAPKKPKRKVAKKTKVKVEPIPEVDLQTLCKDKCREVATEIPEGLKLVHQLFLRYDAAVFKEVKESDYPSIIRECEEMLS